MLYIAVMLWLLACCVALYYWERIDKQRSSESLFDRAFFFRSRKYRITNWHIIDLSCYEHYKPNTKKETKIIENSRFALHDALLELFDSSEHFPEKVFLIGNPPKYENREAVLLFSYFNKYPVRIIDASELQADFARVDLENNSMIEAVYLPSISEFQIEIIDCPNLSRIVFQSQLPSFILIDDSPSVLSVSSDFAFYVPDDQLSVFQNSSLSSIYMRNQMEEKSLVPIRPLSSM